MKNIYLFCKKTFFSFQGLRRLQLPAHAPVPHGDGEEGVLKGRAPTGSNEGIRGHAGLEVK